MKKDSPKKQIVAFFFFAILMLTLLPTNIFADTGPKPSIKVNLSNVSGNILYADLLVPISAGYYDEYDPDDKHLFKFVNEESVPQDVLDTFLAQRNTGWHPVLIGGNYERILGSFENSVSAGKCEIEFSYQIPNECKLILVTEDREVFISNVINPPFTARYELDLSAGELNSIPVESDYDIFLRNERDSYIQKYLISFAITAALTIIIEGILLKLFSLFSKRNFIVFLLCNLLTQALLYTTLFLGQYLPIDYLFLFALAEIAIVLIEAFVFLFLFEKKRSTKKVLLYAVIANIASVSIGHIVLYSMDYIRLI